MIRRMAGEAVDVVSALRNIQAAIKKAATTRVQGYGEPKLVAVSKTKPVEMIIEAYKTGQRHFGENYVEELVMKAKDSQITSSCPDIRWHFIGHLQRKKVNKLIGVPSLWLVESVDSIRIAEALNSSLTRAKIPNKLAVLIQVNTSREPNKSGINPDEVIETADFISTKCPLLALKGLMTIGAVENSVNTRPNPDFVTLFECHQKLCAHLHVNPADMELSMGMSEDFEHAIEMGSTQVRVGSKIFGSRVYHSVTDSGDEKEPS